MNKSQKEQFVYDVLKSLPHVDFVEQARVLLCNDAIGLLPKELKTYTDYLETCYVSINGGNCMSVRVRNNRYKPSDEIKEQVISLHEKHVEQKAKLKSAENELYALIKSCNSVKRAKEILPEKLHKFLPDEAQKVTSNTALVSENLIKNLEQMGFK